MYDLTGIWGLCRSLTKLFGNRFQVRLPHKWGGLFRNDYDHRDFCAIGASAGQCSSLSLHISISPLHIQQVH